MLAMVGIPLAIGIMLAKLLRPITSVPAAGITPFMADSYRATVMWGSSFVLFVAAAVWNVVITHIILKRYLSMDGYRIVVRLALVAWAGGLVARLVFYGSSTAPLSLVVRSGFLVYSFTAFGTALTVMLIVLLIASCWVVVHRAKNEVLSARILRERLTYARLSLYSAAALLIIGVVQIYFLNDWPSHIYTWTTEPLREGLHTLAYTKSIVAGGFYSVFLLMLYVPVLAIYDRRATHLGERALVLDSQIDLSKWREKQALGRSAMATVGEIGAVIGPWLAAIGIPELLSGA
jgi:hypothetical protein